MPVTVLIVGNDKTTTTTYATILRKDYSVIAAHSGRQALAQAKSRNLDAMIVDATSSHLNCRSLVRKLRGECKAPLIVIAAPNAKLDGAFSYSVVLHTPVLGKKLLARLRSLLDNKPPRQLAVGVISLDLEEQCVSRGNKTLSLTPKEFLLLKLLMGRAGQLVSRKTLMKEIWETDYLGDTRTLDVHIRWVREKIEDNPSRPQRLITLRGEGYKFVKE